MRIGIVDAFRIQADEFEQLQRALTDGGFIGPAVRLGGVFKLLADLEYGIEGILRALENHGAVVPAEFTQLAIAQLEHVLDVLAVLILDIPASDDRVLGQLANKRQANRRFAAAAFADQR